MPQILEVTVYQLSELSDKAKEKARDWLRETDSDWWDSVYEDAANVGIKINSFDTGRGNDIRGEVIGNKEGRDLEDVALKIIEEHGEDCATHKWAVKFIEELATLREALDSERVEDGDSFNDADSAVHEHLNDNISGLLDCYLVMLREELDYRNSDEFLDETAAANEYTFLENGKRFG